MHDREAIDMMQRCLSDIRSLRKQVEHLIPRAEAFDALKVVIGLIHRPGMGMGEDITWTLEKKIKELQEAAKDKEKTKDA